MFSNDYITNVSIVALLTRLYIIYGEKEDSNKSELSDDNADYSTRL